MLSTCLVTLGRSLLRILLVLALANPRSASSASLTDFAFSLQPHMGPADQNLVWSPAGLGEVLAMLYPATAGATRRELAQSIFSSAPPEATQSAWGVTIRELAGRGAGMSGVDGRPFQLSLASAVWPAADIELRPQYIAGLSGHFKATVEPLPFATDPTLARQRVNAWVAAQTGNMIPELLGSDSPSTETRVLLTTAVYLNARWSERFDTVQRDGSFTRLDGRRVAATLMSREGSLASARGAGWVAATLPYDDPRLELLVVIPDADFIAFERGWTRRRFEEIAAVLKTRPTHLVLPSFSLSANLELRPALTAIGVTTLFRRADLSGLGTGEDLFVSRVLQKTEFKVGREGTVATSATALDVPRSMEINPEPSLSVVADRPFLFVLRDRPTQTILFAGRVVEPRI